MLLNYTGEGPWAIGHHNKNLGYDKAGNWKAGEKIIADVTVCVPDVNRLSDKFWNEVKKNPDIERKLSDGKVVILVEKAGDIKKATEKNIAVDFEGLEETKAVAIVERCLNKKLLDEWRKSDIRPRIQAAVQEQLEKLKLGKTKKD